MATQYYTSTHRSKNMLQAYRARRANWLGSDGKPEVTSTTSIACCKYYAPSACIYVLCSQFWQNQRERRLVSSTPRPLRLLVGAGGRQGGGHVRKAQRLKRHDLGLRLCNIEGARGG